MNRLLPSLLAACTALVATAVPAQTAPASAASAPARAASAPAPTQRLEVTGTRGSDEEQRRRATAAKIVIGRDEIERMGDSNTLEILKRLPGVTVPGAPGRGGAPRMRGMAGGYTQLLLDGQRVPPGFSLDSIPPEQIERIEILRAPTAETGARAIAGTINIVLREGYRKRLNDLNLALAFESGRSSPSLGWTRNDTLGDWIVNASLSLFDRRQESANTGIRIDTDRTAGTTVLERRSTFDALDERRGLHASARLQWRNDAGLGLMLMPLLIHNEGRNAWRGTLDQTLGAMPPDFARSANVTDGRFTLQRLNTTANHRAGDVRLEWRAGFGDAHWRSIAERLEFDAAGALARTVDDRTDNRDRNATLGLKATLAARESHSLVGGIELERHRRRESRTTLWDGVLQLPEFGTELAAATDRWAVYAQDEWNLSPQWAAHAGLRVEALATVGEGANGTRERNASRVATPLLHAVFKPDPARRDQFRASLTRSWRSPFLNQLIGRPGINRVDPTPGTNTPLTADSAGNPALKPEIALGLDLAFERYLDEGGVLSASLFHRRIRDLIRDVTVLEDASWSPGVARWVSRPRNIGDAVSSGLELEAKFRLDQAIDEAPKVELRGNLSLFRSRVDGIPGPDNRLAEQPRGTLNLGADYRLRSIPLTLGGNVNHVPGHSLRLAEDRWSIAADKTVLDAYALWTFSPETRLRLSVSNALAPDLRSTTIADTAVLRETSTTTTRSYANLQLRLELKL